MTSLIFYVYLLIVFTIEEALKSRCRRRPNLVGISGDVYCLEVKGWNFYRTVPFCLICDCHYVLKHLKGISGKHAVLYPADNFSIFNQIAKINIHGEFARKDVALAAAQYLIYQQTISDVFYHGLEWHVTRLNGDI